MNVLSAQLDGGLNPTLWDLTPCPVTRPIGITRSTMSSFITHAVSGLVDMRAKRIVFESVFTQVDRGVASWPSDFGTLP